MADDKKTVDIEEEDDDKKITSEDDDDEDGKKTIEKNDDDTDEDDDEDDEDSDSDEDDEDEDDDKIVPPVRKHVAQHIITRQKKTIEKLRSKQQDDDDSDDDADDDTNVYDNDVKKAIGAEVQKHLKPLIGALASTADENELKDLFSSEPGAKKYEKRIKAYMQNKHYKGVPPSVIYHHLAFGKAAGSTTEKKKAADLETRQTRGAGSGRRPTKPKGEIPSIEDMEDMDDKQFEKLQHQTRIGKFVKKEE